jgi:hypothetical protein
MADGTRKKAAPRKTLAKVVSQSDRRKSYIISEGPRGGVTCSCPAFRFSKDRMCKHLLVYMGHRMGIESPDVKVKKGA